MPDKAEKASHEQPLSSEEIQGLFDTLGLSDVNLSASLAELQDLARQRGTKGTRPKFTIRTVGNSIEPAFGN